MMSEGRVGNTHTSVPVCVFSRRDLKATHLAAHSNYPWARKIGMFAIFLFWLLRFLSPAIVFHTKYALFST